MMLKIKTLGLIIIVLAAIYFVWSKIPSASNAFAFLHPAKKTVNISQQYAPCVTPLRTINTYSPEKKDYEFIVYQYKGGVTFGQLSTVLKAVGVKQASYTSEQHIDGFMVPKNAKTQDMVNKIKSFPFISSVSTSAVCKNQ